MANWIEEAREWEAFVKWMNSQYGNFAMSRSGVNKRDYKQSDYYKFWVDAGKPAEKVTEKDLQPKKFWELSTEEQQERFMDVSEEPYPAPDGYAWEKINYDPETQTPIKPRWNLVAVDKEIEDTTETKDPYVFTDENGYKWAVIPDPLGGPDQYEFLGSSEDEGVSPNTQAQLDYYRERDVSELERQRIANEQAVYNFETNRLANLSNIGGRPDTGEAEKAKLWDEWRSTFLAEMKDNPRSWINYNELVTRTNPYTPPKKDLVGAVNSAQEQAKTYGQMAKEAKQTYNDIAKRVTDSGGMVDDTELISAKRRYDTLVQYRDSAKNYAESYGQTGQRVNQETGEIIPMSSEERAAYVEEGKRAYQDDLSQPETSVVSRGVTIPSWLPTYVSGLRNMKYLPGLGSASGAKVQANPLSGQAMTRMSDTQKQMLYGYLDYTGQSVPDYLQTTQRQLPQSPTRTSGWTPYRQV